ncbi:MAG: sigma-70 family RNA polymerase sigma factor [Planctomycetes bacterium]|nr:sigma-70 family RNA polymerase sigma factor [Planctomycetota bacterium]
MNSGDTTLGGAEKAFPETTLGFAGGLRNPATADYGRSLETLCARYWKPVYCYLRIAWAKSNEDAKDLTQAFFAWLLEEDALRRYDPSKGGFRPYLKVLLRRFAGHEERDLQRLKRGGGARVFSLDGAAPDLPELRGDPGAADPEKVFERVWLEELVQLSIGRARERFAAAGREDRFRVYEAFALGSGPEPPSYAELAARHGMTVGEVEKALHLVREEIRRELREALARSAGTDQELEDEWKRLLGE